MNAPIVVDAIDVSAEREAAEMEKKPIGKGQLSIYVEMFAAEKAFLPGRATWLDDDVIGLMNMAESIMNGMEARARKRGVKNWAGKTTAYQLSIWLAQMIMQMPLDKRDATLAWVRGKRR